MIVLGLDTSAGAVACAIAGPDGVRAEWCVDRPVGASEAILLAVEHLLREAHVPRGAIDGIAATHGPGSFTGVRVGLAAAQGLALGLSAPLVTLSTIDALLAPLLTGDSLVAGVIDARRGEVYAGAARDPATAHGAVARVIQDCVAAPDDVARDLARAARRGERVVLAGSGVALLADALAARGVAATCAPPPAAFVRAGTVAWLGRARLLAGERIAPEAVSPLYLRDANARTLAERAGAS